MNPKKLIREKTSKWMKPEEIDLIKDKEELNQLYVFKLKEETQEIINSDFSDINEFGDAIQVLFDFAELNGFTRTQVMNEMIVKEQLKGRFTNVVLTNLNPNNPSNKLYFENELELSR